MAWIQYLKYEEIQISPVNSHECFRNLSSFTQNDLLKNPINNPIILPIDGISCLQIIDKKKHINIEFKSNITCPYTYISNIIEYMKKENLDIKISEISKIDYFDPKRNFQCEEYLDFCESKVRSIISENQYLKVSSDKKSQTLMLGPTEKYLEKCIWNTARYCYDFLGNLSFYNPPNKIFISSLGADFNEIIQMKLNILLCESMYIMVRNIIPEKTNIEINFIKRKDDTKDYYNESKLKIKNETSDFLDFLKPYESSISDVMPKITNEKSRYNLHLLDLLNYAFKSENGVKTTNKMLFIIVKQEIKGNCEEFCKKQTKLIGNNKVIFIPYSKTNSDPVKIKIHTKLSFNGNLHEEIDKNRALTKYMRFSNLNQETAEGIIFELMRKYMEFSMIVYNLLNLDHFESNSLKNKEIKKTINKYPPKIELESEKKLANLISYIPLIISNYEISKFTEILTNLINQTNVCINDWALQKKSINEKCIFCIASIRCMYTILRIIGYIKNPHNSLEKSEKIIPKEKNYLPEIFD